MSRGMGRGSLFLNEDTIRLMTFVGKRAAGSLVK
jgi:hypothetical protein